MTPSGTLEHQGVMISDSAIVHKLKCRNRKPNYRTLKMSFQQNQHSLRLCQQPPSLCCVPAELQLPFQLLSDSSAAPAVQLAQAWCCTPAPNAAADLQSCHSAPSTAFAAYFLLQTTGAAQQMHAHSASDVFACDTDG